MATTKSSTERRRLSAQVTDEILIHNTIARHVDQLQAEIAEVAPDLQRRKGRIELLEEQLGPLGGLLDEDKRRIMDSVQAAPEGAEVQASNGAV